MRAIERATWLFLVCLSLFAMGLPSSVCGGEANSSWHETAKVTASDGAELDGFGYPVCLSGDVALVGVAGDDDNGTPDSCDIEADPTIDANGNGIIDSCENGISLCSGDDLGEAPPAGGGDPEFKRGDCDGNGTVFPIADAIYLLSYGFTDGADPPCVKAADVNGDNEVLAIVDGLFLLHYGFTGGQAPPAPGANTCGPDVDDDTLDCASPPVCP